MKADDYNRVIKRIAHQTWNKFGRCVELQDLIQQAWVYALEAQERYDRKREKQLESYIYMSVKFKLFNHLFRDLKINQSSKPLHDNMPDKKDSPETMTIHKDIFDKEKEWIEDFKDCCTDIELSVLEERILNPGTIMTQKELGKLLGVSQQTISYTEKQVMKKLRKIAQRDLHCIF